MTRPAQGASPPEPPGVGVWFDLRNPPAWRQDPARLYAFTLELCEEAERLGADSLWFSEHHGFEDGYLPQPLTFAAAAAARTTRVRLGTGILVAPLRRTAQLAEEAAVVDIISGGRLELGLGAGYRMPEFELFGTDFSARYRILDQQVAELRRLWDKGGLTPQPVQDQLPIWLGYQGPKGARRAGLMGEGLLTLSAHSWPHYRDGLAEGGHDEATARMSGGIQAYVTDDPERDWPRLAPHIAYAQDSYRKYMVEGTGHPVPRPVAPSGCAPEDRTPARCRTSCSARPTRSPRRSGTTPAKPRCTRSGWAPRWRACRRTWPSATCRPSAPSCVHYCVHYWRAAEGGADAAGVAVGDGLGRHSRGADGAVHRAARQPGHDEMIHLPGGEPGLFQGVGHRRLGQRAVYLLAEPLLPHPRGDGDRRPPPVEELGGDKALPDDLGQHRQAAVRPRRTRRRPRRRRRPAPPRRPAARCGYRRASPWSAPPTGRP